MVEISKAVQSVVILGTYVRQLGQEFFADSLPEMS